jgi:hypothetical protein
MTSRSFLHSWLIIGFVTRATQWVPLVEQELHTLLEHLSSPPVFSGVNVTRSLVVCVCFVDRCLSFRHFSFWPLCCLCFFDLRILITSLWYLQTLLIPVDYLSCVMLYSTGADPGFQVRGGGALKKIVSSGGRRENFWGISCEKSRFYAKKSYFFQLRREARTFLGYFVWKITILRKKIIFFPI